MTQAISTTTSRPAFRAYRFLYFGFIVAPFIAGFDKFTHFLTNWDQYLAPAVERLLPVSGHTFMLVVGVIEMAAAGLVLLRPRIGAYVVAAWLLGIVVNLLLIPGYFDVALRDLTERFEERAVAVRDVMTPVVHQVPDSAPVAEAARIMIEHHIHRLVVTKGREPVGIITSMDLLRIVAGA